VGSDHIHSCHDWLLGASAGEVRGDPLKLLNTPRSNRWDGSTTGGFAPIGNIPPADAEDRYYAMLDHAPMAA